MSLNGLDNPKVKEAHEAAAAEPGGWYDASSLLYSHRYPRAGTAAYMAIGCPPPGRRCPSLPNIWFHDVPAASCLPNPATL